MKVPSWEGWLEAGVGRMYRGARSRSIGMLVAHCLSKRSGDCGAGWAKRTVREPGATPPSSGVSPGPRGDGLPGPSGKSCVFRRVQKGVPRPVKCFVRPEPQCSSLRIAELTQPQLFIKLGKILLRQGEDGKGAGLHTLITSPIACLGEPSTTRTRMPGEPEDASTYGRLQIPDGPHAGSRSYRSHPPPYELSPSS